MGGVAVVGFVDNLRWFNRVPSHPRPPIGGGAGSNGSQGDYGETVDSHAPAVQIGILTKGKPTLGMVLVSLLLQELRDIAIHIVDTSESPVIRRDDVVFALRLAFDRGISCTYEYLRERERAFSVGRLKLLESLQGPNICFMDDDVVFASSTLPRLFRQVNRGTEPYGYIAPICRNAGQPGSALGERPHYGPGGIFYQDQVVRSILLEYYSTTIDALDRKRSRQKVWEIAFLTELFETLGRPCFVQADNVCYHLDYSERPNWDLADAALVRNSLAKAHELAASHALLRAASKTARRGASHG